MGVESLSSAAAVLVAVAALPASGPPQLLYIHSLNVNSSMVAFVGGELSA